MPTEATPLVDGAASSSSQQEQSARVLQGRWLRRATSKWKGNSGFARLGLNSRFHWVITTIALLFISKGVTPFVNDIIHATQTGLIDDPTLGIAESTIGQISAAADVTEGLSKLLAGPMLWLLGPRNVWLVVLLGGAINVMLPALTRATWSLYNLAITQCILAAWAGPATTMVIAGWTDGHHLGKALGVVSVATKVTPSLMYGSYGLMMTEDDPASWQRCFRTAAALYTCAFAIDLLGLRSSARSIGFREPTAPGQAKGLSSKIRHPLARTSGLEALKIFVCMRRTWTFMAAFSLLVILKGGAKFASIYANASLNATHFQGAMLQVTYSIASVAAGLCGGFVYDVVPGGKRGIGILMTSLNVLNLCGFIFALCMQLTGTVSMAGLYVFMAVIGFASVLPVSLPYNVYAMGVGGVKHCGMLVALLEFVAHFAEAGLDLAVGKLLEDKRFGAWLGINCVIAASGTCFMALFYYLEYLRAPEAKVLTTELDLDAHDKKSIGRVMLFAAQQAETKEDIQRARQASVIDTVHQQLSSKGRGTHAA